MSGLVRVATLPRWRDRPVDGTPRTIAGEPVRRFVLVVVGLFVLAATFVLIAVVRGPQLSPEDEPPHADYAYQVSHFHVPGKGSLIGPEIRYEWSCHGLGNPVAAGCDEVGDYARGAENYTFGDPPLYYLTTGLAARAAAAMVPGDNQFINFGRSVGALWLFAAMFVLYMAVRRFRVDWPWALAAGVLLPLCPGVLAATSTMTSDAPAALCGAAALWVLAGITVERKLGWVVPALVTLLATSTKILNGAPMLAVGCVAAAMMVAAWRRGDRPNALRAGVLSTAIMSSFAVVYLGWALYQGHRGDPNWVNPNLGNGLPLDGSPTGDLLSNLFGVYQHLTTNYWLAPQINGETVTIWATLLGVVLSAAPLLIMLISRRRSWGWVLGLVAFVGVAAVSLVVEFEVFVENHEYFALVSARYALSFLPWVIACLAVVCARRRLLKTTVAFLGIGTVVLLLAETGLFSLGPALVDQVKILVG